MTLFDLSRELNVSIATVSRALTRPEIVAPDTRERVSPIIIGYSGCLLSGSGPDVLKGKGREVAPFC